MARTSVATAVSSAAPHLRRRERRGSCCVLALLGTCAASAALQWLPGFVGGLRGAAPPALRSTSRAAAATLKDVEASAVAGVKGAAAAAAAAVEDVREGSVNLLEERERDEAKEQLIQLLEEDGLAKEIMTPEGRPLRGRLDEVIKRVERTSPTWEPVYSDLLDGTWHVRFSGSYAPGLLQSPTRELAQLLYAGGFFPGNALSSFSSGSFGKLLGVEVENRQVQIRGGGIDVESSAEMTVFGQREKVSYKAELMPLSSNRMSEEILSLDLPSPLGTQEPAVALRRQLLVTYLDETMMIVRDESGVPDVLVKESGEGTTDAQATNQAGTTATNAQVAGGDGVAAAANATAES